MASEDIRLKMSIEYLIWKVGQYLCLSASMSIPGREIWFVSVLAVCPLWGPWYVGYSSQPVSGAHASSRETESLNWPIHKQTKKTEWGLVKGRLRISSHNGKTWPELTWRYLLILIPLSINIHIFFLRNINLFNSGVLPQTLKHR